eukprot:m51a1_g8697 hypothetical protein (414) ;mRNA; r:56910-58730
MGSPALLLVLSLAAVGLTHELNVTMVEDPAINGILYPANNPFFFVLRLPPHPRNVTCYIDCIFKRGWDSAPVTDLGNSLWAIDLYHDPPVSLQSEFGKSPMENLSIAVSCGDRHKKFTYQLGACEDTAALFSPAEQRSKCHQNSWGLCAWCSGACVSTKGMNASRAAQCAMCGNGVVDEGETCDRALSERCDDRTCTCPPKTVGVPSGVCRPTPLVVTSTVDDWESSWSLADRMIQSCLAGRNWTTVRAEVTTMADHKFKVTMVAAESRASPTNTPVGEGLERDIGECVLQIANASVVEAPEVSAYAGCGDGVVEGAEQCDSSAYCAANCTCEEFTTASGGACHAWPADMFVQFRDASGGLVAISRDQLLDFINAVAEVCYLRVEAGWIALRRDEIVRMSASGKTLRMTAGIG